VSVAVISVWTLSLRERSSACGVAETWKSAPMRAAAFSSVAESRATRWTEQPSAARPRTSARPIPFDAPVTTAGRFFNPRCVPFCACARQRSPPRCRTRRQLSWSDVRLRERGRTAAVARRGDPDFVETHMSGQGRYIDDQVCDILRLQHARAVLRTHWHGPLIEDRSGDFTWAEHSRADAVDALLAVDAMAHPNDAVFGGCLRPAGQRTVGAPCDRCGLDQHTAPSGSHNRPPRQHAIEGARQIAV